MRRAALTDGVADRHQEVDGALCAVRCADADPTLLNDLGDVFGGRDLARLTQLLSPGRERLVRSVLRDLGTGRLARESERSE